MKMTETEMQAWKEAKKKGYPSGKKRWLSEYRNATTESKMRA